MFLVSFAMCVLKATNVEIICDVTNGIFPGARLQITVAFGPSLLKKSCRCFVVFAVFGSTGKMILMNFVNH